MKPRRAVTPYTFSSTDSINASLSIAKLHGRVQSIARGHKRFSRYRVRLMNRRLVRRVRLGTVRP